MPVWSVTDDDHIVESCPLTTLDLLQLHSARDITVTWPRDQWRRYTRARQVKWPGWKIYHPWLPPWLPPCLLLCFASVIVWTENKNFCHIWRLTALFVLFWQWNNLSGVGGLCVLRATTKKVVNFLEEKSASGWPGSSMFWPRKSKWPDSFAALAPPLQETWQWKHFAKLINDHSQTSQVINRSLISSRDKQNITMFKTEKRISLILWMI